MKVNIAKVPVGIGILELKILCIIHSNGEPMTVSDVRDALVNHGYGSGSKGSAQASASVSLYNLFKKGYLEVIPHPSDRRSKFYGLTSKGDGLLAKIVQG